MTKKEKICPVCKSTFEVEMVKEIEDEHQFEKAYQQGRADCLEEMLKLSEEWKNNSGSFLDFQRALRQRLKEQNK